MTTHVTSAPTEVVVQPQFPLHVAGVPTEVVIQPQFPLQVTSVPTEVVVQPRLPLQVNALPVEIVVAKQLRPYLVSITPSVASLGTTLTIKGQNLDVVQALIMDGLGVNFTLVDATTIKVGPLPLMTAGPKSIHAEYI